MLFDTRPWTAKDVSAAVELANRLLVPAGAIVATTHALQLSPLDNLGPSVAQRLYPREGVPVHMLTAELSGHVSGEVLDSLATTLGDSEPSRLCTVMRSRVNLERASQESLPLCRVGFVRAAEHLDRDAFFRYWTEQHAPLVERRSPLFMKYVSNVVVGGQPVGFDGVVEQWFTSVEMLHEHDRLLREEKPDVAGDVGRFVAQVEQYLGRSTWLDQPA
jgi:hypothetical protein